MPNDVKQLDNTIEIVTPENIAVHYNVAGPFRRIPAYMLDMLLLMAVGVAISVVLGIAAASLTSLTGVTLPMGLYEAGMAVYWFIGGWFYSALFETFMNGQTPGKRLLNLRVVTVDGEPIDGMQATLRCLFRLADFMPYLPLIVLVVMAERMFDTSFDADYGIPTNVFRMAYQIPLGVLGLGSMMLTQRYQRIGDLVAGTVVIVEERVLSGGLAKFEDPRTQQLAAILPARLDLTKSTVKALSTYVERRKHFVPERRREIARHIAAPLLERFRLPADTSYDLFLCALYYRQFIAAATDEVLSAPSPFGAPLQSPEKTDAKPDDAISGFMQRLAQQRQTQQNPSADNA